MSRPRTLSAQVAKNTRLCLLHGVRRPPMQPCAKTSREDEVDGINQERAMSHPAPPPMSAALFWFMSSCHGVMNSS